MKKVKLSLLTVLLVGAFACKKNNTNPSNQNENSGVTNADAAAMVAGSVSENSNGVADLALDASLDASIIVSTHLGCGTVKSDSISRKSSAGSSVSYSYNLKYNFTVNCSNGVPDSLSSMLTYSGSFSNTHISSTNSGSSAFDLAGLLPTDNNYVINGEYKRSGSFSSMVDSAKNGNSNIVIMLKSLTILKSNKAIQSGTATIAVSGDVPNKGNFSYTGTLVFNGDGTAKLTLNSTIYNINLSSGACVKA